MHDGHDRDENWPAFKEQLRPIRILINSVAAETGADIETRGFYGAASQGIEHFYQNAVRDEPGVYYIRPKQPYGGMQTYDRISSSEVWYCFYDPAFEAQLREQITNNIRTFNREQAERKARKVKDADVLLDAREWASDLVPLKPLIDSIAKDQQVKEKDTAFYRLALRDLSYVYTPDSQARYLHAPGGNRNNPTTRHQWSIYPATIAECFYNPGDEKALRAQITQNLGILKEREKAEAALAERKAQGKIDQEHAREQEKLAQEAAHREWMRALLPLKPLIDSVARTSRLKPDDELYRSALYNIHSRYRRSEGTLIYVHSPAGQPTPETVTDKTPAFTRGSITAETIKHCYYDPAQALTLREQIATNLQDVTAKRESDELQHGPARRRREQNQYAREMMGREGVRYVNLDKLLKDANRTTKEAGGITRRLCELYEKSAEGPIVYMGKRFDPGDIVVIAPTKKSESWSENVRRGGRVAVIEGKAEELASLVQGSRYRLPRNMPSDWFSNILDFPDADGQGPEKHIKMGGHRKPSIR